MQRDSSSSTQQAADKPEPVLRFAVMCTGHVFPAWQAACIRAIVDQGLARPVLLIIDEARSMEKRKPLVHRLRSRRLAWNIYDRLFVRHRSRSTRPVDLANLLEDVPSVRCIAKKGKDSGQYFDERDIGAIKNYHPDFILRFGFNIIRGEILSAARFGVWSFHHDDLDAYRGPPACFWPSYFADPAQGITLQKLTEGIDCGVVLKRSWLKCVHHDYARNRDNAFLYAADMPASVCRDIINGHTVDIFAAPSSTSAPIRTIPGPVQVARFVIRSGAAALRNAVVSRVCDDQWALGLVDRPVHSLMQNPLLEPRWILPTARGHFLADPFVAKLDENLLILAEEYTSRSGRGHISALLVNRAGAASEPVPVIMEPHHLSYPFLLERHGELFCVPESAESGEIGVYSSQDRPGPWRRVGTLLRGIGALDPTIVQFEDRWWMFICTRSGPTETRLQIFHAQDLFGPWQPHVLNPVKSDIRSSRPAGTPFVHGGVLYRPAQDCSRTYGGSVLINRVELLTPGEFREVPAVRLQPGAGWPFPHGMHTLSWTSGCMVIDAKRRILLPRAISSSFPIGRDGYRAVGGRYAS